MKTNPQSFDNAVHLLKKELDAYPSPDLTDKIRFPDVQEQRTPYMKMFTAAAILLIALNISLAWLVWSDQADSENETTIQALYSAQSEWETLLTQVE